MPPSKTSFFNLSNTSKAILKKQNQRTSLFNIFSGLRRPTTPSNTNYQKRKEQLPPSQIFKSRAKSLMLSYRMVKQTKSTLDQKLEKSLLGSLLEK